MSFVARYDPAEDRMRLELQPVEGEARAYWVTRRQWLALLARLQQLRTDRGPEETTLPPRTGGETASPAAGCAAEPVALRGLRVEQGAGRTRIILAGPAPAPASVLGWPDEGLPALCARLALQAERAGWDPEPALSRLEAMRLANASVQQVGKQATPPDH